MINVTIDNKQIQVPEGTTILKAARMAGIHIPTLCYFELAGMKFENKPGGCRVCVVEVTADPQRPRHQRPSHRGRTHPFRPPDRLLDLRQER